ncbi:unnamed protein product [Bursaphelenchus xylophilus]|uniref:non-specific serine/threonine protein kinase n=1 Tax=Bursaphelenchus xylophilus TaxID=6326 RepID=A0A7I8XBR2_BURXY|nr:unnamed protein product [Bursaphelenchus xylophilus]CAG9084316.1 unnamed protein product [Bursaphelenchus xylophilus]
MSRNQEADLFKKTLSDLVSNKHKKIHERTNASEMVAYLWGQDGVVPALLMDNFENVMDMLCQVVIQECEMNESKIGKKIKSFSQTLFKVWKAACIICIKKKGVRNGSIFLYCLECLLKKNRGIWVGSEDGVWWDTLDVARSIFVAYDVTQFPDARVSNLLHTLMNYVFMPDDSRKELVKLCELLSIFVESLRYLPQSENFEGFLQDFTNAFVKSFNWSQGLNPARTSVLIMMTSLLEHFSFGYRVLLLDAFMPVVRQLFPKIQIWSISGEAISNPGEHKAFNRYLLLFLDMFLEVAYPRAKLEEECLYIDGVRMAYHLTLDVYNAAISCLEREKTRSNYAKNCAFDKDSLRFLARLLGRGSNNQENFEKWGSKLYSRYSFHVMICRSLTDFLQNDSELSHSASIAAETLALYLTETEFLETADYCFLNSNLGKWLEIPGLQNSSSVLIANLLKLGVKHLFNFASFFNTLCQLRKFSQPNIQAISDLMSCIEFDEESIDSLRVETGRKTCWTFRKDLIQRLMKSFSIQANPSCLIFKLFLYFPSGKRRSFTEDYIIYEVVDFFVDTSLRERLKMETLDKIHLFRITTDLKRLFNGNGERAYKKFDRFHDVLGNELLSIFVNNSIDKFHIDENWRFAPHSIKKFISERVNVESGVEWRFALAFLDRDSARPYFIGDTLTNLESKFLNQNVIEILWDTSDFKNRILLISRHAALLSRKTLTKFILELERDMLSNRIDNGLKKIALREIVLAQTRMGLEFDIEVSFEEINPVALFGFIQPTCQNVMRFVSYINHCEPTFLDLHARPLCILLSNCLHKLILRCECDPLLEAMKKLKQRLNDVLPVSDTVFNWFVALKNVFQTASGLFIKAEGVDDDLVKVLHGIRSLADVLVRKSGGNKVFMSLMGTLLQFMTSFLVRMSSATPDNVTEEVKQAMSLIVLDVGCVGRVIIGMILRENVMLFKDLLILIDQWLRACAKFNVFDSTQCAGAVFRTIDTIYVNGSGYPELWKHLLQYSIPLISEYVILFSDPEKSQLDFSEQVVKLRDGRNMKNEPFVTCFGFWCNVNTLQGIRLDLNFLKELWRLFPHLRTKLLHYLPFYDQKNVVDYGEDMWAWAKGMQTNGDDIFTVKYVLYLQEELCPLLICCELYSFLISYERKMTKTTHSFMENAVGLKRFLLKILTACDMVGQEILFTFLHKPYFGIKAVMSAIYRCLESKKKIACLPEAMGEYAEYLLNESAFDENDVFLCACLTKAINLAGPKFDRFLWAKVLHLVGLYEPGLLVLRYCIDSEKESRCLQAFEHTKKNLLSSFSSGYRGMMNLYKELLIKAGHGFSIHGISFEDQVTPQVKAFVAQNEHNWTRMVTALNQSQDWKQSSLASYHLGNNDVTLDLDEGYECLMNLTMWSLDETKNIKAVLPKTNLDNVGTHLYTLFKLIHDDQKLETVESLQKFLQDMSERSLIPGKELVVLSQEIEFLRKVYKTEDIKSIDEELRRLSFRSLNRTIPFVALKWKKSTKAPQENEFLILNSSLMRLAESYLKISSEQRAEEILNFAYDVTVRSFPKFLNNSMLLKANLFKSLGDDLNSRFFLEKILREYTVDKKDGLSAVELVNYCAIETDALIMLADMSSDVQESEEHLKNAALSSRFIASNEPSYQLKVCKVFAAFCQKRFTGLDAHKNSTEFKMKDYIVKELEVQYDNGPIKDRPRLGKELHLEKADLKKVLNDWTNYLLTLADCYIKALRLGTDDKSVVPRLAALIVQNYENEELMSMVKNSVGLIPSSVWLVVTNVLSGYLFIDKPVSSVVFEIMVGVVSDYPYHSLNTILYHFHRDDTGDQNGETLRRLLNSCSDLVALKAIIRTMRRAVTFYESVAKSRFDSDYDYDKAKNSYIMDKRRFQTDEQFENLLHVPVPIVEQPVPEPQTYSVSDLITFSGVSNVVLRAGGASSPKILTIRTSEGVTKRLIVKPEDLRQDDLAQVLFKVANILIREEEFKGDILKPVQTYIVVPITDNAGLIEYVDNTVSLNRWLVDEQTGAHLRYNPEDTPVADAISIFKNWNSPIKEQFLNLCRSINPVFRHFFYENFSLPHKFFESIRLYTDSLALWSILCFVVGLGDRHLNNILVDERSGMLVHIDLGMIFDFSQRILQLPERVPFRLTRDLMDPILIDGANGRFKHVAVYALERLRENADVIVGLSSLLLLDPMTTFPVGNREDGSKNMLAENAIARLKAKLDGTEANYTRASPEQQVNNLIKQATDPENLCQMLNMFYYLSLSLLNVHIG